MQTSPNASKPMLSTRPMCFLHSVDIRGNMFVKNLDKLTLVVNLNTEAPAFRNQGLTNLKFGVHQATLRGAILKYISRQISWPAAVTRSACVLSNFSRAPLSNLAQPHPI